MHNLLSFKVNAQTMLQTAFGFRVCSKELNSQALYLEAPAQVHAYPQLPSEQHALRLHYRSKLARRGSELPIPTLAHRTDRINSPPQCPLVVR